MGPSQEVKDKIKAKMEALIERFRDSNPKRATSLERKKRRLNAVLNSGGQ